jgi:mycothiol synthase
VPDVDVLTLSELDGDQAGAVLALIAAAAAADGSYPVSEPVRLQLRRPAGAINLLAYADGTLAGYAYLDGAGAELAVHPERRGTGAGEALLDALEAASPGGRLLLWAHGEHADAAALAKRRGYVPERVLWQLRRPLADLPVADLPAGVTVRPFRPGEDEAAWVALNNRAFADHPDQGGWTMADIAVREQEPWFDPAGFLLAERDGTLVGFHWTKVDEGVGEVYVLGVDPAAGGRGLGAALTAAGLRYLRARGLSTVMLYVDDTNQPALRLYERMGFIRQDVDIRYNRRPDQPD